MSKTELSAWARSALRLGALAAIALLAVLGQAREARAQWTQPANTGSNISNTNTGGNVGVGNQSPFFKFTVGDPSQQDGRVAIEGADGGTNILFNTGGANRGRVTTLPTGLHLQSLSTSWFRDDFFIRNDGNVGIGTTSPTSKLDVRGLAHFQAGSDHFDIVPNYAGSTAGNGLPRGTLLTTAYGNGYDYANASHLTLIARGDNAKAGDKVSIMYGVQNYGLWYSALEVSNITGGYGTLLLMKSGGKVGLGTSTPAHTLDVAGQVRSSSGGFVFPDGTVQTTAAAGGTPAPAAANVSAGQFGAGTGGGNYSFPAHVLMNSSAGALIDAGPSNRFKVCGPSGSCSQAGEYVGGRIRLSPDGSFASAEVAADPGMGGINAPGNVIVGGNINAGGTVTAGNVVAKFQDVAEWVPSVQKLQAGTVVALDPARSNHVLASASAYDTAVAGVVSAQPGLILGEAGEGRVMVATTGRVKVRVDASKGAIRIGDLLVTSVVEGVAMKSVPVSLGGVAVHRPGTIIGKALEPLEKGVGEILVLLSMQ